MTTMRTPPPGIDRMVRNREGREYFYTYHWTSKDDNGNDIGANVRYNCAEGSDKTFRAASPCGNGWKMRMPEGPHRLFGLYESSAMGIGEFCAVTEGPRKAAALHQLGIAAVSVMFGAYSVDVSDFAPLSICKRLVLLPDNDEAGEEYARSVATKLSALPDPPKIETCRLPGLTPKGDIVDWLQTRIGGGL